MKKLIIAIMSVLMVLSIAGLTACKNNNSDNNDGHELWTIQKVYAQAQDLGFEGTLEELIALFKGDKGETGAPGENGINGQDGIGIKDISVNSEGKLIIVLSNNSTIDCGVVKGQDGANGINGKDGKNGQNGADGVGVKNAYVDENLHLWIELTNGTKIDAGYVGVEVSAPVVEKYTVTFYDYDGTTELKVEEVVKGESATAPENPTRWGYTFTGWDKTFDNVTENISITAIYTEITEPTFIVTSASVNAGENAVITLTVKNNPGIMNAMLNLTFNDVELTLTTAENGPALSNSTLTKPKYLVSGCNFIYDGLDVSNTDDGVILTLTFETSLNAMSGTEYSIEFSYVQGDIVDGNLDELTLNTINGKITIK